MHELATYLIVDAYCSLCSALFYVRKIGVWAWAAYTGVLVLIVALWLVKEM